MTPPFRFYNPHLPCEETHNRLPHLEQQGITYFATFRLADSVPTAMMDEFIAQKRDWLAQQPDKPWSLEIEREYHRRFSQRFERWLDQGHGECLLKNNENARVITAALKHFEAERSLMHAWVVMPNHVHVLVSTLGEHTLAALMHSWKGYSSRQINAQRDATGALWQKSYYDRMIRDWDHFISCARYIRNNPRKANLPHGTFLHEESPLVRKMLGTGEELARG
jgi:putative transposase